MSRDEHVVYEFYCDRCGHTEEDSSSRLPYGWVRTNGRDFCEDCKEEEEEREPILVWLETNNLI